MAFYPDFYLLLLLVFVRIGGVMVAAPFFNLPNIPVRVRVFLALIIAYTVTFTLPHELPPHAHQAAGFFFYLVVEALTGLLLGFAAQFIFFAVQFAGEAIGFQIGLSLAQVYNPIDGTPSNPLGRLLSMTLLLVFVLLDGHHYVLEALSASFQVVPPAGARLAQGGLLLQEWMRDFFVTALRLAAPFMITIFLVDTALGVFSRVVPQADLFTLSLPLKLMTGLVLTYLIMQTFIPYLPTMVRQVLEDMLLLVDVIRPG